MANVISFRPSGDEDARTRQDVVHSLYEAISGAVRGIGMIPGFVREAFEKKVWQGERIFAGGTRQPPITFAAFVHEPYPVGLGTTYATVRQFLGKDAVALRLWDEAVARPVGRPETSEKDDNVIRSAPKKPTGNSAQAGVRRLRKAAEKGDEKATAALKRVEAGEVSPNAAAIEMGWRKPTLTVVDAPEPLLAAAEKRVTVDDMARRAWSRMSRAERVAFLQWAVAHTDD